MNNRVQLLLLGLGLVLLSVLYLAIGKADPPQPTAPDKAVYQQQLAIAVSQVKSKSIEERVRGATALGNIMENPNGFDVVTLMALGKAINDSEAPVRLSAIAAAGQIGQPLPELIGPLRRATVSADLDTVKAANNAFDTIRTKRREDIDAWIHKLKSSDTHDRAIAALQLSLFGPAARDAAPLLLPLLDDSYLRTRENALQALAMIGPSASDVVLPFAQSEIEKGSIQRGIQLLGIVGTAAKQLSPRVVELLLHSNTLGDTECVLQAIDPSGDGWVSELKKGTVSSDVHQRERTAQILWRLAQTTKYSSPSLRPHLTGVLKTSVSESDIPLGEMLSILLDDKSENVRRTAAIGLSELGVGAKGAEAVLARHLPERGGVSEYCGKALCNIGPTGIDSLVENIDVSAIYYQNSPICHIAAATVLSESFFYEAMLSQNWQDDTRLPWALASMEACAERGIPAIVTILKSSDPTARKFAADALMHICTRSAGLRRRMRPLDSDSPDIEIEIRERGEKSSKLLQTVVRNIRPALQAATNDDDSKVRESASKAIKALDNWP